MTQKDDGSRNALDEFMRCRDENTQAMVDFCSSHSQYWKGRVFLELLWSNDTLGRLINYDTEALEKLKNENRVLREQIDKHHKTRVLSEVEAENLNLKRHINDLKETEDIEISLARVKNERLLKLEEAIAIIGSGILPNGDHVEGAVWEYANKVRGEL